MSGLVDRQKVIDALFERARALRDSAADVAQRHGHKLFRRGRHWRGVCPLCGSGAKSRSEPFVAADKGPLWFCHACQKGGELVGLERELGGHRSALDAACALLGEPVPDASGVRHPARPAGAPSLRRSVRDGPDARGVLIDAGKVAAWMRAESIPAEGTIVESWLASRRLDPQALPGGLQHLRFHPRAPVAAWLARDGERTPGWIPTAPAMIAPLTRWVRRGDGDWVSEAAGVHVTYLSADGGAKAQLRRADGSLRPSRKVWGDYAGCGHALTDIEGAGPLIVGEGIETVWAFAQAWRWRGRGPCRALAAISLGNLQGSALRDKAGFVTLDAPEHDPDRAVTTIPRAGEVIILADADMKPIEIKLRSTRGARPKKTWLGPIERAAWCGALAQQAWRRAGANPVRVLRPPVGMDFNDWLRRDIDAGVRAWG